MENERQSLLKIRQDTISRLLAPYVSSAEQISSMPEGEIDDYFMGAALTLARQAAAEGEVPVGCVIVKDGHILSADYNGRETFRDAVYHAETSAIRTACEKLGGWRLVGCTMYVTLEPCPMCAGAAWCARLPRLVYGAKDNRAGAMGTLINLNSYPLNHKPRITIGVRERECRAILQDFFASRRKKSKKTAENKTNTDGEQL